jgi:YcaO-like protein with predicted kinase domain
VRPSPSLATAVPRRTEPRRQVKRHSHRTCAPAETLARIRPFLAPMGITRVADVTGLDAIGVPVVMVVRPNSRSLSVAQGKGLDLESAKASGLMESIESYHAERIMRPVVLARHADLVPEGHGVVDPARLPQVRGSAFHSALRLPWIEGFDVVGGAPALVPFELVHTDFTVPLPQGSGCFPMSSNGLASGNSFLEAVNHGICELIERDAVALWLAGGRHRAQPVDLSRPKDPRLAALLGRIGQAGCRVAVEEITSDVGVPVFTAVLTGEGLGPGPTSRPAGGAGCHPDRTAACLRAVTEAAQSRLTRISGSRDDLTWDWYDAEADLDGGSGAGERGPGEPIEDGSGFEGETVEDDFFWLVDALAAAGLEQVVVVDLGKPEFGLSVVRVLIPGLEGLPRHPDYAPGPRARRLHA